jgi:predicted phage terminase large subunit-like protein
MSHHLENLTPQQIQLLISRIPELPTAEKVQLLEELEVHDLKNARRRAREDFLTFCHRIYPGFKEGAHHRHLRPLLHDMARPSDSWGEDEPPPWALRMTVSMAPRFGKSETISYLYVAWYLGHNPTHQVMMVTHTEGLSSGFGKKVRDLIDSAEYQAIFEGSVQVSKDKSAAGNWTTAQGGVYLALGVGGSAAGMGAHLLVCDDLVSEQAVLYGNPETAFSQAWDYVQVGPLQRLMPGGRIIMIGTRWGKRDPIARAIQWSKDKIAEGALTWHEVRFPAVMEVERDGVTTMVSLWPEQWPLKELMAKKANMRPQFWAAQYLQEPTNEAAALIKREFWNIWTKPKPPEIDYIIQTWDTAHETKTRNDYSACTTWGIWVNEAKERNEIILLDYWKGRVEYPELKKKALEQYNEWRPDDLIIEKKAAGAPLIQELRRMDMFVMEVSPSRGRQGMSNDKYARTNAVTVVFEDGHVWVPDNKWGRELIEVCADFPNGEFDDPVDCLVAGTKVCMADGTQRAVEHVVAGDFVHTPYGAARVASAGPTGLFRTYRLRCGGRTLEGTANHPIATERGWVQLQDVRTSDTIKMVSIKEHVWHAKKSLFFRARNTTATPTPRTRHTGGTSAAGEGRGYCTGTFGQPQMALCRRVLTCITETMTRAIMRLTTSNLSTETHTGGCMQSSGGGSAPTRSGSISNASAAKRPLGTPVKKARYGMLPLLPRTLQRAVLRKQHSPQHSPHAGKTPTGLSVLFAVGSLMRSVLQPSFVATRVSIDSVEQTNERRQVFNLSVEGAQCFYANGVLTHNCTVMAMERFRRGGFISLSTDAVEEDNSTAPPMAEYY